MTTLRPRLLVAALALGACAMGTDVKPPVAPRSDREARDEKPVDPAIERWFRGNTPSSGTRIVAGDRITVSVQGNPELAIAREVPEDGAIPLYRTDQSVNALHKTPQELESEIAKIYAKSYTDPYVTVSLEIVVPRQVYVLGAVHAQGAFTVRGSDRITLLQAIAMAGGPSNQADLRHVTIRRFHEPSGRVVSSPFLDIDSTIARNDDRDNLVLEPGDTIVVPEGKELRVQVLGHVERPGSVTWTQGMTVSTAITELGGFKRFAKTNKIKVVRNGVDQLIFDFDEMMEGRMKDLELEPGDVVYVDEKWI